MNHLSPPCLPRPLLGALVLAAAGLLPVHAADPVVLKNKEVTESALIDALNIDPPQGASGAMRGFKPAAPGAAATPPKPAAPGRANLLITFETNSAALTGDSQSALDTVGKALQSDALAGLTFRVEGHADARGDAEINRKLSQQRAEAVVGYLVSKHGVLPERLQPQGKGSAEPLNKDRIDAPENRRVTIVTIRG
ncbi:OmpA family protein [Aquabacterium sp.]|uniref:OmpA family protein n=1 Tax=Aquabacterium sp. TaxID=1872578 RepID=UPI002C18A813|nr:OmpA family protein [Aquabacterium sp.]HSW03524.1 OmpA family protein [Aquabacterium sp.]